MLHAPSLVVVLALAQQAGATESATPPSPASSSATTSSSTDSSTVNPVDPTGEAAPADAPPVADDNATVTLPPEPPTLPVVAFLGVAAVDADRALADKLDGELRALLLADRQVAFAPSSAPVIDLACFDDVACRASRAASLEGAHVLVARGETVVDAAGASKLSLSLALLVRADGRVEQELSFVEADEAVLMGRLAAAYDVVMGPLHASDASTQAEPTPTTAVEPKEDASVVDDDADLDLEDESQKEARRLEAPAKEPPPTQPVPLDEGVALGTWIYIGAFVAGGALVALSGAVFDLASPTSLNGTVDVFDAVGPSLVVVGAVIAVVGVATGLLFEPFGGATDDGAAEEVAR